MQKSKNIRILVLLVVSLFVCQMGYGQLVITSTSFTDEVCKDDGNGSATVVVDPLSITGAVTYIWSNGGTTATISNLSPGTYTVTVGDDNPGTVASAGIVIDYMADPSITVCCEDPLGNVCYLDSNGTADGQPTQGFGNTMNAVDFTYLWGNGETTKKALGLTAGWTTLVVTDIATGCSSPADSAIMFDVAETVTVDVVAVTNNPTCNGGTNGQVTALVAGGDPSLYTFTWSTGSTTAIVGSGTDNISSLIDGS
ncbi:MAG: SprB repeat-containing protein, partial [Flavobacteriales bacterium]|nr:SprB repeat-containing protein [Flavobacteriales bacterium]